uniref:CBFD_NFYB_HMF domain-containing protein n=1 Tax=Angiostrongylus cantonensis TaxID=6313 RepID=A0A0K0D3L6_ANGCA
MATEDDTTAQNRFRLEEILSCSIPTSRVKKICRLDPELSVIANDAVLFLTKATELFVAELAKASYTQAVLEKRKTIQTKDLNRAIASKSTFDFLEDALTGWPEKEDISQATVNLQQSVIEENDVIQNGIENSDDDMQDVCLLL